MLVTGDRRSLSKVKSSPTKNSSLSSPSESGIWVNELLLGKVGDPIEVACLPASALELI